MPKSANQKIKILYLVKFLLEQTDVEHSLTVPEMISQLQRQGISAERKSIYDDLETLQNFGLDIVKGKNGYFLASRLFELPELKLLVDAVQASKFITLKKSEELIAKIETLVSQNEAKSLHRQVYVGNRIKTMNESIYYNIDKIHETIIKNLKICFYYFEYDAKKQKQYRHGEKLYQVSPYALCWSDENYYMIAFDAEAQQVKHYRVDKMDKINIVFQERDGKEIFDAFDIAVYTRGVFGMFGGDEERVTLRLENRMVGIALDRFGKEISIIPDGEHHFLIHIHVKVSPQFLAWIFGLGSGIKIVSPEHVKQSYVSMLNENLKRYGGENS